MAKIIKNLTKVNIRNTGIEVSPEHDFSDDGNFFRGFIYKGIPMTQCYSKRDNEVYLSIRIDYISNQFNFTYKDWMETEGWKLCHKYNGVSEFDLEELIEVLEKVIAEAKELDEKVTSDASNEDEIIERLEKEIDDIDEAASNVMEFMATKEWWTVSDYELRELKSKMATLMMKAKEGESKINQIKNCELPPKEIRALAQTQGTILSCDYYIKVVNKILDDNNKS